MNNKEEISSMRRHKRDKNFEIIPAVLEMNFARIEERISQVVGLVKTVQIDVCDGKFVANATWPYRKQDDSFDSIVNEDLSMPHWDEIDYEIDLMCLNPLDKVDHWVSAGAKRIIIHASSVEDIAQTVADYRKKFPKVAEGDFKTGFEPELCIALAFSMPVSVIAPFADQIDGVQCMGIDKIGFQGRPFQPGVYEKIKELRALYPNMPISVDGGVNVDNILQIKQAGATRVAVGSAVFASENANMALEELECAVLG